MYEKIISMVIQSSYLKIPFYTWALHSSDLCKWLNIFCDTLIFNFFIIIMQWEMYANNDSRSHITCPTQPHSKQFQGREEFFFLTMPSSHLFIVIPCQIHGKGPLTAKKKPCYNHFMRRKEIFYLMVHLTHFIWPRI